MLLDTLMVDDFLVCYFCGESDALPNNASIVYKEAGAKRKGLTFFSVYFFNSFYYSFKGCLSLII
jgi:hypothetical protein